MAVMCKKCTIFPPERKIMHSISCMHMTHPKRSPHVHVDASRVAAVCAGASGAKSVAFFPPSVLKQK